MIWKDFSKFVRPDSHAFCSPSKKTWRNWSKEQLLNAYVNSYSQQIGTLLHAYACENIKKNFKMQKSDKHSLLRYLTVENKIPVVAVDIDRLFSNLMLYVNDCIGFRMRPEEKMYLNDYFFGTADAIRFTDKNELIIFDLKTGVKPIVDFGQLENYAALFCAVYKVKPIELKSLELRLYQNSEIMAVQPDPMIIEPIIDQMNCFTNEILYFTGETMTNDYR